MVESEISAADIKAVVDLNNEEDVCEAAEVVEIDNGEQQVDEFHMDIDEGEEYESVNLHELSAEGMTEEIQNRLDHLSDTIIFAHNNSTFGETPDAEKLMMRMQHLSIAVTDSLSLLQQLEHKRRQLRERQGNIQSYFLPDNSKKHSKST